MAICPYCKKEVKAEELVTEKIKGELLRIDKSIYCCPHCKKILSIVADS